jgi:hypothetical protein
MGKFLEELGEVGIVRDNRPWYRRGTPLDEVVDRVITFRGSVPNHRDREPGGQQFHDLILLPEEPLKLGILGIVLLHLPSCLIFWQEFVPLDRSTLQDHIDPSRFELVYQGLELPKEVVDDRGRSHEKTTPGTMTLVHKIDYKDGHKSIVT